MEVYSLIGYENKILEQEDFDDYPKDAGETGAGKTITALYEIVPKQGAYSDVISFSTIDFRYKEPYSETGHELGPSIIDTGRTFDQASENMRFAASLAGLAMQLQDSHKGNLNLVDIKKRATEASTFDPID